MAEPAGLEFKAYEIEELADVYVFRPLGMIAARMARALRMTPNGVTLTAAAIGVAGGAMLVSYRLALAGFGLLMLHSVLDSADGQLARMTRQVSEWGRMLDGAAGYVTHISIYLAILFGDAARAAGPAFLLWAVFAAIANVVHAQLYDYHRNAYKRAAIDGVTTSRPSTSLRPPASGPGAGHAARGVSSAIVGAYDSMERWLAGAHPDVEATIAARAAGGAVRPEDRARYRECFYWVVRSWNVFGDLPRFYAIGVLAWFHHLDWFFAFILVPMNGVLALVWLWQWQTDRRFLAGRLETRL